MLDTDFYIHIDIENDSSIINLKKYTYSISSWI